MTLPSTILVTGGAGFIGANFVHAALATGVRRIVNLDALTYAGNTDNLASLEGDARHVFVHGNIADAGLVRTLLREHQPGAIVNFAAETHVDRSIDGPLAFVRTNVVGTVELLEAARTHAASVFPDLVFLHVSTDEVFGSLGPEGRFREETPYAPNSPYAASKASADHFVRAYGATYGLRTITTNCSNNYGPFQFPEKLIPLCILNALEGRPLPVYGDGGNIRDWLYVGDHCAGILAALARGQPGRTYNFGGSAERTNLEVVGTICALLDELVPPTSNPALAGRTIASYSDLVTFVTDRPGHDRRYAVDASRATAELDWRPSHGFHEGMRETVRWYVANRAWCARVSSGSYRRERLGLTPGGGSS